LTRDHLISWVVVPSYLVIFNAIPTIISVFHSPDAKHDKGFAWHLKTLESLSLRVLNIITNRRGRVSYTFISCSIFHFQSKQARKGRGRRAYCHMGHDLRVCSFAPHFIPVCLTPLYLVSSKLLYYRILKEGSKRRT
jgi:hypothetical protein